MTELSYKQFALYSYSGAVLWAITFLSVGYFLGGFYATLIAHVAFSIEEILTAAILIVIVFITYLIVSRFHK